jgi:hypothetical protein
VQEASRTKGVQLHVLKASTETEIDAAFATLMQTHAGALVLSSDGLFNNRLDKLVAPRHAIPAIYHWREFPAAGGLISYGPSRTGIYHEVGIYVGRILKGANHCGAAAGRDSAHRRSNGVQPERRSGWTRCVSRSARKARLHGWANRSYRAALCRGPAGPVGTILGIRRLGNLPVPFRLP